MTLVFMKLGNFHNCNVIYILRRNVTSERKKKIKNFVEIYNSLENNSKLKDNFQSFNSFIISFSLV